MGPRTERYSDEALIQAVAAVRNGTSVRKAASKFNIPASSLYDKVHNRTPLMACKSGPRGILTSYQEKHLVEWFQAMAKIGCTFTSAELPDIVVSFSDPEENGEKRNPSKTWISNFLKRHPELYSCIKGRRTAQKLINDQKISWFEQLKEFLQTEHEMQAEQFLSQANAHRIYNAGQCWFPVSNLKKLLLVNVRDGVKPEGQNVCKNRISFLTCSSAQGQFLPKSLLVFPALANEYDDRKHLCRSSDYIIKITEDGAIDSDIFYDWLRNHFYPSVQNAVEFPIVLLVTLDTHGLSSETLEFCRDNQIIIYYFPSNTTAVVEPLEYSTLTHLKKCYNSSVREHKDNPKTALTIDAFQIILERTWQEHLQTPESIVSAFERSGIVPFNSKVLKETPAQRHSTKLTPASFQQEKIGLFQSLQIIEDTLTPALRTAFEDLYSKNNSEENSTMMGMLYTIFRKIKDKAFELPQYHGGPIPVEVVDVPQSTAAVARGSNSEDGFIPVDVKTELSSPDSGTADKTESAASSAAEDAGPTLVSCIKCERWFSKEWSSQEMKDGSKDDKNNLVCAYCKV